MKHPNIKTLIFALIAGAVTVTAQASSDPAQSRRRLLVQCSTLHSQALLAKPEEREQLLTTAPALMQQILALKPTNLAEYRELATNATFYWRTFVTDSNRKEVLQCLEQAAEYAELAFSDPHVRSDDLRNVAHLYHTMGINGDREKLIGCEMIHDQLFNQFKQDVIVHDFACAANTQINIANYEPHRIKERFTKALHFINWAAPYIDRTPLALLKMHLPFVKQLHAQIHEISSTHTAAKPLAMKFNTHVKAVQLRIDELERNTPINRSPMQSSPSPTASTEDPTPSPDAELRIEDISIDDEKEIQP